MAFGTLKFPQADAGRQKKEMREAAVQCWFTADGRALPMMLKLQEENGEILKTDRIRVTGYEKKYYAGVPSIEYRCRIVLQEQETEAILCFLPESCCWKLMTGAGI